MLIWFRNGVWDYRTQELTSYDDSHFEAKYPHADSASVSCRYIIPKDQVLCSIKMHQVFTLSLLSTTTMTGQTGTLDRC